MGNRLKPDQLPGWEDCISIANRPWYFSYAPRGKEWFSQLKKFIQSNELDLEEIKQAVKENRVRPSLIYQIENDIDDPAKLPENILKQDLAFKPIEFAVSTQRLRQLRAMNAGNWGKFLFSIYSRLPNKIREGQARPKIMYFLRKARGALVKAASVEKRESPQTFSGHNQNIPPYYDLVFLLKRKSTDRGFERICSLIGKNLNGRWCIGAGTMGLPPRSKAYYFQDAAHFLQCIETYPDLRSIPLGIFWDNIKSREWLEKDNIIEKLNIFATAVFFRNSQESKRLIQLGLNPSKAQVLLGSADPDFFIPHTRTGQGKIGFCGSFHPRRLPEKIIQIAKAMPHRQFLLLSPRRPDNEKFKDRWTQYSHFKDLTALPNLTYVEAPYTEYPKHYAQMDVFISVSEVEGGPLSLLEAMMCNIVPVASHTGFAPDLIQHGKNGFLFDPHAPVSEITSLIDQAYSFQPHVRNTVEHLSWKNAASFIQKNLHATEKELSIHSASLSKA